MDSWIPKNDLLCANNILQVRKLHNLDKPGKLKEAVTILEEWVKKQNHFVKKDFSRHRLEMMLLGSKGSIEITKSKLDTFCTYRTALPQYFDDYDIKSDFEDLNSFIFRAPLPKLTNDHLRVVLVKANGSELGANFARNCIRMIIMYCEYFYTHDYNDGFICLLDLTELDLLELASKLYPAELRNGAAILMEAMALRLKGIHMISKSKVIETIITILKQVVNDKIKERIYSHKSIRTVYDFIPQEILPVEYGGKERSYKILHEEFLEKLSSEKFRAHQKEMLDARTDESKRSKEVFNQQYMGMPGTFRSLCLD